MINELINSSNPMDENDPFDPIWDNPMDTFESAMSSMVSSPVASHGGGDNFVIREVIGRLGNISNSDDIGGYRSTNTSCYSTPLNSPPKHTLMNNHQTRGNLLTGSSSLGVFQGFPETGMMYSSFPNGRQLGGLKLNDTHNLSHGFVPKVYSGNLSNNPSIKISGGSKWELGILDSAQNCSISETGGSEIGRKRKSTLPNSIGCKAKVPISSKSEENNEDERDGNTKAEEPPKDYIHVRVRRGQATDPHSLAERVRREKISDRMKLLQDLVPGCNKVTGKAGMLDEIINYVKSLQQQVEFMSMRLSAIDALGMNFSDEAHQPKEQFQPRGPLHHNNMYQNNPFAYPFQLQKGTDETELIPYGGNPAIQWPPIDSFNGAPSPSPNKDDLQSVLVQAANGQNQTQNTSWFVNK